MNIVTVSKRKRPAGCGRWDGYQLGTDTYGSWVFTPAGSIFYSDDDHGHLGSCEVARDDRGRGRHSLLLLPRDQWFVACWALGAEYVVSIDIATPPRRTGPNWTFTDLELDPFLHQDGTFGVEDEDEFQTACKSGLITDAERAAAMHAVQDLRLTLTAPGQPFVKNGLQRLNLAIQLGMEPLA